jgi:hypothetical protein
MSRLDEGITNSARVLARYKNFHLVIGSIPERLIPNLFSMYP